MGAGNTAQFSVKLSDGVSQPANAGADAMEQLRARIAAGDAALKNMNADLRRLRGTSDEVVKAKAGLKTKIDAERNAISSANLQILKGGKSYGELADAAKKASSQVTTQGKVHGQLADAAKKATTQVTTQGKATAAAAEEGGAGMSAALAGVAGAALVVVGALVASGSALVKWGLEAANAARSAGLVREAITGSAQQSDALGSQIDALARKIPTAKAEIQALSVSMIKSGLGGQTLVDSMNAVGQASAALGDDVGNKLRAMLERGLLPNGAEGRFFISPNELRGTGLAIADVAKSLAPKMKTSVEDATQAILAGRVSLGDGAAALREAVEGKLGKINLRKMLDLDTMKTKFAEGAATLTKGINLEPALEGLSKFGTLFSDQTVTGKALQSIVSDIGNGLVKAFTEGLPVAEAFVQGAVIGALKVEIAYYKIRNAILDAFEENPQLKKLTTQIDGLGIAADVAKIGVYSVGAGIALIAAVAAAAVVSLELTVSALQKLYDMGKRAFTWVGSAIAEWEKLHGIDGRAVGKQIIDGLVAGLEGGVDAVKNAVTKLADKIKSGFTIPLSIHSPSRVTQGYGEDIDEGAERGIERGGAADAAKRAAMKIRQVYAVEATDEGFERAVERGGPAIAGGSAERAPRREGSSTVVNNEFTITINVEGERGSSRAPDFVASIRAELTKAIEEMCVGAGVPVQRGGLAA